MNFTSYTYRLSPASIGHAFLVIWLLFTPLAPRHAMATDTFTAQDMLPILEDILHNVGADASMEISLTNATAPLPAFAASLQSDAATNVTLSKSTGRFVVRFADPGLPQPVILTGFARTPVNIPVLIHNLQRGDIITAGNIEWISSLQTNTKNTITQQENLEGMIARRPLRAGQPLRGHDVTKPVLVSRGALITMQYKKSGLNLSHRAIAEESGGAGDIITVRNPRTDRTIRALVSDHNRVEVIAAIVDNSPSRINR